MTDHSRAAVRRLDGVILTLNRKRNLSSDQSGAPGSNLVSVRAMRRDKPDAFNDMPCRFFPPLRVAVMMKNQGGHVMDRLAI